MQFWQIVALIIAAVVLVAAVAWVTYHRSRSHRLRELKSRPLNAMDRQRFSQQWMACQRMFVDTDVIRTRGYAADDLHDRMSDIAEAYPEHADHYRVAGDIVARHRRGKASTEDLRNAFLHYRALFDEILGGQDEELKRVS